MVGCRVEGKPLAAHGTGLLPLAVDRHLRAERGHLLRERVASLLPEARYRWAGAVQPAPIDQNLQAHIAERARELAVAAGLVGIASVDLGVRRCVRFNVPLLESRRATDVPPFRS